MKTLNTYLQINHNLAQIFPLLAVLIAMLLAYSQLKKRKVTTLEFLFLNGLCVFFLLLFGKLVIWQQAQWIDLFSHGILSKSNGKSALGILLGSLFGISFGSIILRGNLKLADSFALSIPIGLAISRLGCFMGGCCYGIESNLPWAISNHQHILVHPTQLYELLMCLIAATILSKSKFKAPGNHLFFAIASYIPIRFISEFFRSTSKDFMYFNYLQITLFVCGIAFGFLIFIREKWSKDKKSTQITNRKNENSILFTSIAIIIICKLLYPWFDRDELRLLWLFILIPIPMVIIKLLKEQYFLQLPWHAIGLFIIAPTLMSQKPVDNPQKNHTSIEFGTLFGQLYRDVNFGATPVWKDASTSSSGCPSPAGYYPVGDTTLTMQEKYVVGSFGISHVIVGPKNRSMEMYFNVMAGENTEKSNDETYKKSNLIFGVNPGVKFETNYLGLTLGYSLGMLSYNEMKSNMIYEKTPYYDVVNQSPQLGLRLFSEKYICLEAGYNLHNKGMGERISTVGFGSRFKTENKMMLHFGFWTSEDDFSSINNGTYFNLNFPLKNKKITSTISLMTTQEINIKMVNLNLKYRIN